MTQPAATMTYQEALLLAAAARAATATTPDAVQELAALIRAAAAVIAQTQETTVAAIRSLWANTNPYDDASVERFAAEAGRVLVPAQRTVAQVTASMQTQQFAAAGVRVTVSPTIPDDVRGAVPARSAPAPTETPARAAVAEAPERPHRSQVRVSYDDGTERQVAREDSRTSRVMVRVAGDYRYARSQGRAHVEALAVAENRIDTIVDGNLQAARAIVERRALDGTVDLDREIIGYRRIIHPELSAGGVCGMCVVAADRKYKISDLKAIHNRCKCTVLPIYDDFDPGAQLNGEDLQRLYDAAGGNTRNRLKRTRYKIVEHSELGPMLVSDSSEPVPYFPAPAPA